MDVEFVNGEKLTVSTHDKTVRDLEAMIDEKQQDIKTLAMLREEGYQFDQMKPEDAPNLEQAKKLAKPFARKFYEGLKPV